MIRGARRPPARGFMRVLLVTGIWPPDVGGPATHGPELARFLVARGHEAVAVTMADGPVSERPCAVVTVPRSLPFPVRYPLLALRATGLARRTDVVYASATYAAAAAAARAARRPLVAKLVSDPAYERARRYGLFRGTLEEFQDTSAPASKALKRLRTAALSQARTIVVPSEYLARIAAGWGLERAKLLVVPNAAPAEETPSPPRAEDTFVFAGRLTEQKALHVALEAIARLERARLVLVGDGPERERLERLATRLGLDGRVEFRGAQPRSAALEALAGATAAVLPSAWENFPHAAVEALAVGTPVVATPVGGVPEIVRDGENGLLVETGSVDALAEALRSIASDAGLRERLSAGARPSVAHLSAERVYGQLEEILAGAAR
jgi:glycosyltransferase involved in cell wall biosynthesis